MQGQWMEISETEQVGLIAMPDQSKAETPEFPAWARYVQSRLRHFRCSAHPRGDPHPIVPRLAPPDD